jgi:hypothetical protein
MEEINSKIAKIKESNDKIDYGNHIIYIHLIRKNQNEFKLYFTKLK